MEMMIKNYICIISFIVVSVLLQPQWTLQSETSEIEHIRNTFEETIEKDKY